MILAFHLVHAEQQVIDWLKWLETHNLYAREGIPGIMSPAGYVVIGRRNQLSDYDLEKLRRRNQLFRGQIGIPTYDDLLVGAKNLLNRLSVSCNATKN